MNTFGEEVRVGGRRRRKHSAEFKALVVAACKPAGVSIASVAMAHGVNANLARRWIMAAQSDGEPPLTSIAPAITPPMFVPLRLPSAASPTCADIRIELRRGGTKIDVIWPATAATECAAWMRELLR